MCRWHKELVLFSAGGALYALIEVLWRGHTHWTMSVLGGALFVVLGLANEVLPWEVPLALQAVLGGLVVTLVELVAGLVLNVWLGLEVWDYSHLPFHLWGQICLEYTLLWMALSAVAVVLDDWLRYWLWDEESP